ncbi:MAG TPA: outer membrane lipoprotein carrier protein LolA [Polyangiaceae bacterium]|jgi:outer membrane lipoprotein carrier protein|nr:outer membrane lipoprotein carrier protein LolA [Polyangiaceae bacterium]
MPRLRPPTTSSLFAAAVLACAALYADVGRAQPAAPPAATPAAAPAQALPSAAQAVDSVQAFYDKSTTFKSDFQQKFWVKAYNHEKSSSGHVTFAKPGRMEWVYDDPKDNRVVSDGKTIRVYEANNKQMFEQPVDSTQYPAALSFLTGTGKLGDSFDFQILPGDQMKFPGGYVLAGTPKQATAAYSKVLFYVDAATSQVRRVMVIDGQGNRNRFDFVSPRVNEPVTPSQFTFTPPPGTSIVRP